MITPLSLEKSLSYETHIEQKQFMQITDRRQDERVSDIKKSHLTQKISVKKSDKKPLLRDISNLLSNKHQKHKSSKIEIVSSTLQEIKYKFKSMRLSGNDLNLLDYAIQLLSLSIVTTLIALQKTQLEKQTLTNTFISIGKYLQQRESLNEKSPTNEVYFKRIKPPKNEPFSGTYAFAFTSTDIFICLNKSRENRLGQGTYRLVTKAIKIPNPTIKSSEPFENVARLKAHSKEPMRIKKTNDQIDREYEKSTVLFDERELITAPFFSILESNKRPCIKKIAFQKLYQDSHFICDPYWPVEDKINPLIDYATSLDNLHLYGIIHGDVKFENFFVDVETINGQDNFKGVLADLGSAPNEDEPLKISTLAFLAPEGLRTRMPLLPGQNPSWGLARINASEKLDSFSFGVTLLEILEKKESQFIIGMELYKCNELDTIAPNELLKNYRKFLENSNTQNNTLNSHIINIDASLSEAEKKDKLDAIQKKQYFEMALIHVAFKLIQFYPQDRISCQAAVKQLKEIKTNLFTREYKNLVVLNM